MSTRHRHSMRVAAAALVVTLQLASAHADGGTGRAWLNPMNSVDKTRLNHFVEEPLFDPARKLQPVVAPVVYEPPPPAPPPPPTPPNLHLLGVIQGVRDVAIVRQDEAKTLLLHSGDVIDGWKVEVLPTGLRLHEGTRAFDFALFKAGSGASAGPVAADPEGFIVQTPPLSPAMTARDARLHKRQF